MGGQISSKAVSRVRWGSTWSFCLAAIVSSTALAVVVSPSCTQTPPPRAKPKTTEPVRPALGPSGGKPNAKEEALTSNYADAIRRRQFKKAARLIDNASAEEQRAPEVRYARALVAIELGDSETALRLVDKLGDEFPLFSEEAKQVRIDAAKRSQDVTLLLHLLAGSESPHDQLLVAEAHEKSASLVDARKLAEKVLLSLSSEKSDSAKELRTRAHHIKARTFLAEDKKEEAAREFHWLATEGAKLDPEGEFAKQVSSLSPNVTLSIQERKDRLKAFSEAGLFKRAEEEIAHLAALAPEAGSQKETDALLAWAVFNSRSDYARAAQLFHRAASHGGKDRREYLYYEAKALARSHRDGEAIGKYEAVAALGGPYADHASYQAAHLRFITGDWKLAVSAYEKYLKAYGANAKHREGARSSLPIARLAAKDFARAQKELSELFAKESSERERARLLELMGVAYLGEKKTAEASKLFRQTIEYRPLSFSALLAAARLREMGESVPALMEPPPQKREAHKAPLSLSLPEKVWRLNRVGLDEEAERALRAEEPTLRRKYKERSGEALCRAYGLLQSAQRRYQIAQTAASWSVLKHEPRPEDEWQWDCIYPTPYGEIAHAEATARAVPVPLIYGVMRQESAFRPTVVSPAQAVGLMQIIPPTAKRISQALGEDYSPDLMRAPAANIRYGAYYLRVLLDTFQNRPELAAASYNAGPHAVSRWLRAGEQLPLDIFVAMIPYQETRNYVYLVMGNYARYAYRDSQSELPVIDLTIPKGMRAPDDAY